MGQLVLTVGGEIAGALIGGPIGAAIGGALGSLAGAYLFPVKGPTPQKLQITDSSYGAFLPWCFGTIRVAGKVIWADPNGIQQNTGSGGKGGQSQASSTATLTFQVAMGDALNTGPYVGILYMLFDGKRVYSTAAGDAYGSDLPMTVYLGSGDQLPDPVAVAIMGPNKVSGYPFTPYVSFENLDITKYGRIPNVEFIVITQGGSIPWRVESWTVPHAGAAFSNQANILSADFSNNVLGIGHYVSGVNGSYTHDTYQLDGTHIAQQFNVSPIAPFVGGGTGIAFIPCVNDSRIAFATTSGVGSVNASAWYVNGAAAINGVAAVNGTDDVFAVMWWPMRIGDALYAVGGNTAPGWIAKYDIVGGIPQHAVAASYLFTGTLNPSSNNNILWSDDGNVWVASETTTSTAPMLWKFDSDLNLLHSWVQADLPTQLASGVSQAVVYQGNICSDYATSSRVYLFSLNADFSFTEIGNIPMFTGTQVYLDNGLILTPDGVISLNPPPADITVGDAITILNNVALDDTDYDVTEQTDILPGYLISNQMTIVDATRQLLAFSASGAVESDFKIKYPKFNKDPVAQFIEDDYAFHVDGSEAPGDLPDVMDHEQELPQSVTVTYMNTGADYQPGAQQAQRQSTISTLQTQIALGIAMSDQRAIGIAGYALYDSWEGRHKRSIETSRKYLYLDPLDNVIARDRVLRITDKNDGINGIVSLNLRGTDGKIFTQAGIGSDSSGFVPRTPTTGGSAAAGLVMLDLPLINDSDPVGPYAATDAAATLFVSSDNVNYTSLGTIAPCVALGVVTTPPADFTGGNVIDTGNVFRATLTSGALASIGNDDLLNGGNMFAVGGELIQSRDLVLVTAGVYDASAHLRGRRGTEFATATHVAGEPFVALPATSVALSLSDFGRLRYYKAVKAGQTIASATAVPFVCNGAALRPYAPVQLGGGTDGSGNVTLNWKRRTRVGGAWPNLGDVPLSETTEAYVIQIWDSTYSTVARLINATTQTCSYTSAQQVTDFGSQQKHIYFTVQQVGSYGLGTAAQGIAGGAGGSDASVIAPIPPYGGPPPMGGGCTLPVTTATLAWTSGTTVISPVLGIGDEWVIAFTPGTSTPGNITITIAEYGGGPIPRDAVLAIDPCGSPLTPFCFVSGARTVTFSMFMQSNPRPTDYPTVVSGSTYHVSVNPQGTGQMYAMIIIP